MKIVCCVCVMAMLCGCSNAEDETTKAVAYKISDQVASCSRELTELVTAICGKIIRVVKREASPFIQKLMPRDMQEYGNKKRKLITEKWRRIRRQIASECCDQPCSVGNLILYCAPTTKLIEENPDIYDYIP